MIIEALTLTTVINGLKISGTLVGALGFLFGVFKVINWIKTKFTSIDANVVELKNSMNTHITGLREDIRAQTATISNELREQRQDFRTFYGPTLTYLQAAMNPPHVPIRAKKSPIKKKK